MPALDFPANPTNGQVYGNWIYSTSKGAWQAKPLTSAVATPSDTAPLNPDNGDLWYNTTDGSTYVYYVDGTSAQWVQTKSDSTFSSTLGPRVDALEIKSPNYVINGGFDIWQRGTSFTQSSNGYTADRWTTEQNAAATITRQIFTPGTELTPSSFFLRYQATSAGSVHGISTRIEDVRTLAGQTATLSFWAKAAATTTLTAIGTQWFGSGGSSVFDTFTTTFTLTTSWQRFTYTTAIASISGKTVGDGSYLGIRLLNLTNTTFTMDIDGVQLEAGSSATVFRRNANSLQGELAACQRYFHQFDTTSFYSTGRPLSAVRWSSTSPIIAFINHPVPMRVAPSLTASKTGARFVGGGTTLTATFTPSSDTFIDANTATLGFSAAAASATAGWIDQFAVLQFSAEL